MTTIKSLGMGLASLAALTLISSCGDDSTGEPECGNRVAEQGEECDLDDLNGATCDDLIPGSSGTLFCNTDCTFFTDGCEAPGQCGNGVKDFNEDCDLDDLGGLGCADVLPGSTGTLACSADCSYDTTGCAVAPFCGNGIADATEECDGTDLGGLGCADVVPNTAGTLACDGGCLYDTSGCVAEPFCGDGTQDATEECDCGTQIGTLPPGCTDVNGGANANCDLSCARLDLCGDGLVTGAEACDCGDPSLISTVPAGCLNFNDTVDATCDGNCELAPECHYSPLQECDPLQWTPPEHGCCPDPWNNVYHCKPSIWASMSNMCALPCTSAADCYWNNECLLNVLGPSFDLCIAAFCSPGNIVDAPLNGPCQSQGGQPGYCAPIGRYVDTHEQYGYCIESGALAHGAVCPNVPLLETDRTAGSGAAAQMCDTGLCVGPSGSPGVCAEFCDWEAEYDAVVLGSGAPGCPSGSNCFSESTLSEDQVDPQYADYGWRRADLAYCLPTEANHPTLGKTTCSLVTGQLMSNPGLTCATTHTNGICTPAALTVKHRTGVWCQMNPTACVTPSQCDTDPYSPNRDWCVTEEAELTLGTLIGVCAAGQASGPGVWGLCTPGTDSCPLGSWCLSENAFDDATGPHRCVPFCDTQVHNGVTATCQDLGAPASTPGGAPECTSASYSYLPWVNGSLNGNGGADDPDKSRLGFCALPRP